MGEATSSKETSQDREQLGADQEKKAVEQVLEVVEQQKKAAEEKGKEEKKGGIKKANKPLPPFKPHWRPKIPSWNWSQWWQLVRKDLWTVVMSLVFLVSVVGFVGVLGWGGLKYYHYKQQLGESALGEQAQGLKAFIERQKKAAFIRVSTLHLGGFLVPVKHAKGEEYVPGVTHMAVVYISVVCNTKKTCVYLKAHLPQVQDRIYSAFPILKREDILSVTGKKEIKALIRGKLNEWLPFGKIKVIYFTKIILS